METWVEGKDVFKGILVVYKGIIVVVGCKVVAVFGWFLVVSSGISGAFGIYGTKDCVFWCGGEVVEGI